MIWYASRLLNLKLSSEIEIRQLRVHCTGAGKIFANKLCQQFKHISDVNFFIENVDQTAKLLRAEYESLMKNYVGENIKHDLWLSRNIKDEI